MIKNLILVIDALDFSSWAHRTQRRKDAKESPHFNHLVALVHVLTGESGVAFALRGGAI